MASKKSYEKAGFWVAFADAIFIIAFGIWNVILANKTMAEPKFEISFQEATPADEIFSQNANPYWIFKPNPEMYGNGNKSKLAGKRDRVTIQNVGKRSSPQTFVRISVEDPFSIALISVYIPGYGWLDSSYRTVRPADEPKYQKVMLEITMIIGKEQKIEIYPLVVYSKVKRKRYEGKDEIAEALKVAVHSSALQKTTSLATSSFSLEF